MSNTCLLWKVVEYGSLQELAVDLLNIVIGKNGTIFLYLLVRSICFSLFRATISWFIRSVLPIKIQISYGLTTLIQARIILNIDVS